MTPRRRPRRQFDDDFKAQAVRLVLDQWKTIPTVARDLDLTDSALRNRIDRARADPTRLTTAERHELARLRVDIANGRRSHWKSRTPSDPVGVDIVRGSVTTV